MSNSSPAYRRDAVVAGVNANNARSSTFQAKLAVAGERMQPGQVKSGPGASESKRTPASGIPSRPAAATTAAAGQATNNRNVQMPSQMGPHRHIGLLPTAPQRMRRFNKSTPRQLRDRLSRLATRLGVAVIDVWTDVQKQSVVLIVDQPGYSKTRFIVEYGDAAWQVEIKAGAECDADCLLGEAEALQERFNKACLGPVILQSDSAKSPK